MTTTDLPVMVKKLSGQFMAGVPVFLLIDPLFGELLSDLKFPRDTDAASLNAVRTAKYGRDSVAVVLHERIHLPVALHPYLLALHSHDDEWLTQSVELADSDRLAALEGGLDGAGVSTPRIGGWLQSALLPEKLCIALSQLMYLNAPFMKTRYLRLADWRAMDLLRHVVGEVRITQAMRSIQRWVYLNHQGHVVTLNAAKDSEPLVLNDEELDVMKDGEAIHRTISCWLGEAPATSASDVYAPARRALEVAKQAAVQWPDRFKEQSDYVACAVLELMHPGFQKRSITQRTLATSSASPIDPETPESLRSLARGLHTVLMEEKEKNS